MASSYIRDNTYHLTYTEERNQLLQQQSMAASYALKAFGKPTTKKRIHKIDILAAILSLLCLILGIAAVAIESVSWHLGVASHQLIVLGFLLNIMNICLASVASPLFLLIEARFGRSTIQNYDGLLRGQVFASRLSFIWRSVLGLMLVLPIGLSVAYKSFTGGESVIHANVMKYTGNSSYYGMFAPPGLRSFVGVSSFFNATLAFTVATAPVTLPNVHEKYNILGNGDSEPPLPKGAQPYGHNVLLLNNESSAILDMPQPNYVSAIQSLLADGESWNMTAPVLATVASFNRSKVEDLAGWNATFVPDCEAAQQSTWAFDSDQSDATSGLWAFVLVDHPSPGNQTQQYLGLCPGEVMNSCEGVSPYVQQYDVTRQQCEGTWSVTRGGIQLLQGSCKGTMLPQFQIPIIGNALWLGANYMPSMMEFLGPFATTRNQSAWIGPYFATATAAMVWSRIVAYDTTALLPAEPLITPQWRQSAGNYGYNMTNEEVGLIYPVNDTVIYIRPTLQKSKLLYLVLIIQPLLLVIMLLLSVALYSSPVDKGFGLISILSGIDRESLGALTGAALSGELRGDVKLVIKPVNDKEKCSIEYYVTPSSAGSSSNGTLAHSVVYH